MTATPQPTEKARSPGRRVDLLRSLRLQVSIALLVAAGACAYVAGEASESELAGVYRDSGDQVLETVRASFGEDLPGRPAAVEQRVREAARLHGELRWVGVFQRAGNGLKELGTAGPGPAPAGLQRQVRQAIDGGRREESETTVDGVHLATLVAPLDTRAQPPAAVTIGFDLTPYDEALADRRRTIILVLAFLLLGFTLFTALVLDRGIFRPLARLRAATNRIGGGDLSSRLRWGRRDELGVLAQDFDVMADALELNRARLEALALEDPLTGLANHRRFQEVLAAHLEEAEREDRELALVIIDIDQFKRVNDARGHPFGDELLRRVGEQLRAVFAGVGDAARLGGDEFAVVLPGTDRRRALALSEAGRAAVTAASPAGYELTCSAGVACYPTDARSAPNLVQLADGALFWAKESGRNRSRAYEAEHVLVVTSEQRDEFAAVIEQPQAVRPVFQPIVAMATGEVVGYEALARFDSRRQLPPSWWFTQAHRFGLGQRLEAEAVRAALRSTDRPPGTFLSLNLSPSALRSPEVQMVLPDDLTGLVIELTEQEEILDGDGLHHVLAPLRARGAKIAVDDAGAGYAGLQQVMKVQADVIKLDRALISGIQADTAKAALVRSLVHFAEETGAELCAEGIETLEELRMLSGLGVKLGQGYVLGVPAPPWADVAPEAREACRRVAGHHAAGQPAHWLSTARARRPG